MPKKYFPRSNSSSTLSKASTSYFLRRRERTSESLYQSHDMTRDLAVSASVSHARLSSDVSAVYSRFANVHHSTVLSQPTLLHIDIVLPSYLLSPAPKKQATKAPWTSHAFKIDMGHSSSPSRCLVLVEHDMASPNRNEKSL